MTTELVSVRDLRQRVAELLSRAEQFHERTIITVNGKPTGVLLGYGDYESLMETLDVLGDPATVAALAEAEADVAAGRVYEIPPGTTLEQLRSMNEHE